MAKGREAEVGLRHLSFLRLIWISSDLSSNRGWAIHMFPTPQKELSRTNSSRLNLTVTSDDDARGDRTPRHRAPPEHCSQTALARQSIFSSMSSRHNGLCRLSREFLLLKLSSRGRACFEIKGLLELAVCICIQAQFGLIYRHLDGQNRFRVAMIGQCLGL
jgi:hypothetical protein